MATNIGTGPEDIPLNQHLGQMAYLDEPPRAKCYVAVGSPGGVLSNTGAQTTVNTVYGTSAAYVFADLGGDWDIANTRFTAPQTGIYQFNMGCRFSGYGNNLYYIYMTAYTNNYRGGGQRIHLWSPGTDSGGTYRPHSFSGAILMYAGDSITPSIRITTSGTSSSTLDSGATGQNDTFFDIYLVG
tara:strand:- start:63 stop:617 length:555 start_codon:yes stop_codon:yes gene_type:complete